MPAPLHLLLAEDNPLDAELLLRELRRADFAVEAERVDSEPALVDALARRDFDLVLSDFQMPQFDGLRALELLQQSGKDIPFILVSGTMGEDVAVEAMRRGAADYLLKDRLSRLGPAVTRALAEARLRRERHEAVAAQRESERLAQAALHALPAHIAVLDAAGRIAVVNPAWSAMVGEPGVAPIGTAPVGANYLDACDELAKCGLDAARALASGIRDVLAGRRSDYELEYRKPPPGIPCWYLARVTSFAGAGPRRAVVAHDNITSRKLQQQALQVTQFSMERSADAIVWLDATGAFVQVNDAASRLFGYAREELLTMRAHDLNPAHPPTEWTRHWEELRRQKVLTFEAPFRDRAGRIIPVEVTANHIAFEQQEFNCAFLRDVTARRAAEAALRESESRFRQVVETIQEVFWLFDLEQSRLIYVSPGYERIWGRTCESLYASAPRWFDTLHPEDRAAVEDTWWRASLSARKYRIVRPDGSVRWIHDRAFPVRDESGAVRRLAGVAEDITDQRSLEEQFLRAQRLEAVGTLSNGIAHDLNNILAPVLMIAPLLREKLPDPSDQEMLEIVAQSASRGAGIVRQLLTFSRGQGGERGPLPLLHLVREMATMMRETFPREIEIAVNTVPQLWTVVADPTQVHQVLMNLCVNARDAMPEGGRLTLAAENVLVDAAQAAAQPDARPGPYVALSVADTGTGIAPEVLKRIFEPFFTTKGVGKGTGLGLSTVIGIVRGHGGYVTVTSEVGRGTCFRALFPADDGNGVGTREGAGAEGERDRGRNEHILVVDDEDNLRETLRRALQASGYRVTLAASGREALEQYSANPDAFDLVLTDVMMPGISGVEVLRAVKVLRPQARVLVSTGMVPGERQEQLAALGINRVLPKPTTVEELLAAVREQLQASG